MAWGIYQALQEDIATDTYSPAVAAVGQAGQYDEAEKQRKR
jgi:hypothetical protein